MSEFFNEHGFLDPGPDGSNHLFDALLRRLPLQTVATPNEVTGRSGLHDFGGGVPDCDAIRRIINVTTLYVETHDDAVADRIGGAAIQAVSDTCRTTPEVQRKAVMDAVSEPLAHLLSAFLINGDINAKVADPAAPRGLNIDTSPVAALECLAQNRAAFNRLMLAESLYVTVHLRGLAQGEPPQDVGTSFRPVVASFAQTYSALVAGLKAGNSDDSYERLVEPENVQVLLADVNLATEVPASNQTFGPVDFGVDQSRLVYALDTAPDQGIDNLIYLESLAVNISQDCTLPASDLVRDALLWANDPYRSDDVWRGTQYETALQDVGAVCPSGQQ